MWVCVLTDIIMSAIMLIFMDKILLAGASSYTCEYTETYLTIIVMSVPFMLISKCYKSRGTVCTSHDGSAAE